MRLKKKLTSPSVGKGAAYIYIELIMAAFSGYLLWLFLSKMTTPDVIGTASTVISLGYIFATIVSFGIPNAIPRFLGKMFSERNLGEARLFVSASLFLTCIGIVGGTVVILFLQDYSFLSTLGSGMTILSVLFMASTALATLFRYLIISSFKSNLLASSQVVISSIKVALSIFLVLMSMGAFGLTFGYTISQIVAAILLGYLITTILKNMKISILKDIKQTSKKILVASVPSWIPASITLIGAQAGTIIVFGSSGSHQAGTYFIAFSLFTAVSMIISSLFSAAFPVLSAMQDGRKRFSWRILKISLIIALPISFSFLFYSENILGILGRDYVDGATSLDILLLSVFPTAVMTGVNTLVYTYGNYRQVLGIGLALSVPRTLLYFVLVPYFGGSGAALSFTIGSVAGFIFSILVAKKIGFKILWKDLAFVLCIPAAIAFALAYSGINYIFGIPSTIVLSYVVLVRIQILTRHDVQDTLGVLPFRISNPAIKTLNLLGKKINPSY